MPPTSSSPATSSALSADVVAAIDDLELAARIIVEGLRTGGHRSPFHGYSMEFKQHRPYRAGDDLKHLDWKLYARSDRLYTRQYLETTNLSMMIVLDTSASMGFPETGVSKLRYGAITAAALAYLATEQGNAVGLMSMTGDKLSYVPARGGRVHLRSLLSRLDRLTAGGQWDPPRAISRGAQLLQRRGLVVVISDFYDAEETTRREIRHVVQRGHDVVMLQLISKPEMELSFSGQVELEDLESRERRLVDASTANARYRAALKSFLDRCRTGALRDGVDYALITTDTPPSVALRDYLLRRARRVASTESPASIAHGGLR
jgi:uncharacterized protein (DUF58 family)